MRRHAGSHPVACVILIAAAVLSSGCSSTRGVVDDARLTDQLDFLNQVELTRHAVEARLGMPTNYYEKGDVVSYWLYLNDQGQLTTLRKGSSYHSLMLHYAPDGHLLRYALIRQPR
jgi:hypothetical protein